MPSKLCQKAVNFRMIHFTRRRPESWLVSPACSEQTSLPLEMQSTRKGRVIPNGHSTHSNPGPRSTVKFLLQWSTLLSRRCNSHLKPPRVPPWGCDWKVPATDASVWSILRRNWVLNWDKHRYWPLSDKGSMSECCEVYEPVHIKCNTHLWGGYISLCLYMQRKYLEAIITSF